MNKIMELEEMKSLWQGMSKELKQQQKLTDKIIIDMTKVKYQNKIQAISTPESIGAVICLLMAVILLVNLEKLDTWYLMTSGLFSVVFLIFLPVFSLRSISKLKNINIQQNDYKQTLLEFSKRKNHFLKVQKIGVLFSFIFLIVCLPVTIKIIDNKDIFLGSKIWYWYLPIGILFLFFFSRWGYNYYSNITRTAEKVLEEIQN